MAPYASEQPISPRGRARLPEARAGNTCVAPASPAQERLWFFDRFFPQSPAYNLVKVFRLRGPLHPDALEESLRAVVERHGVLRTTFAERDGEPVQIVHREPLGSLERIEKPGLTDDEIAAEASRLAREDGTEPFDLETGPLLRARLIRFAPDDHALLLAVHHIVSDGLSFPILYRDLTAAYESACRGERATLPALPGDYVAYVRRLRERTDGGALAEQFDFWRRRLADAPPLLELPADRARPPRQSFAGARRVVRVPERISRTAVELGRRERVTPFMTFLAAFQTLLYRYSGQEDILVGCPVSNRADAETENLVGLFVNMVVLRTSFAGNPTFRDLLRAVRGVTLDALANPDVPFEQLARELQPGFDPSHQPLFQVMFQLRDLQDAELSLAGLEVEMLDVDPGLATFDLTLHAGARDGGHWLVFEYNTDLFDAATIDRMAGHLIALIEHAAAHPTTRVGEIPLLAEDERRAMRAWNDTARAYPRDVPVGRLFERRVESAPDATALLADSGRVTYRELNARANRLARFLRDRGVGKEARVGVLLERSADLVVALLATLKVGGAYVPMDAAAPEERVRTICDESGTAVLVTSSSTPGATSCPVVHLGRDAAEIARLDDSNLSDAPDPRALACVIHTSGSTGKPKGVAIEHRGLVNRLAWMWEAYPFEADDVACLKTSPAFVDSLWELLGPLLGGVPTLVVPDAGDPRRLADALAAGGVTRMLLVPSLLRAMLEDVPDLDRRVPKLTLWVSSGEPLPGELARRFFERLPGRRLVNLYGMSEAFDATVQDVAAEHAVGAKVPAGRPIANMEAYVLDAFLEPVPTKVAGELYVGGAGLARGYLGRPDLTAERFVPNPFGGEGARLYRTGDVARILASGDVELLGRTDDQVKVRGVRVEPGEVEAALCAYPDVAEAAVAVWRDERGDPRLVAYVVPRGGTSPTPEELRRFARGRLLEQAVPSAFVVLDDLPRTQTGKVNRRALPPVEPEHASHGPIAPRTRAESALLRIWQRVLGRRDLGVTDDFFEAGGHSLLAVKIFNQIEKEFGKRLPLASLFEAPTIAELAPLLEDADPSAPWSSLVSIKAGGTRAPLYFVHGIGGDVLAFRELAEALGADQPVSGLRAMGMDGQRPRHSSVEEMAAVYVAEILAAQPNGPYHLAGQSFGGYVAFEMARQLLAARHEVGIVVLLDTYGPGYLAYESSASWLATHLSNMRKLGPGARLAYAKTRLAAARLKATRRLWRMADRTLRRLGASMPRALENLEGSHYLRLLNAYKPQPYAGQLTLVRAEEQPVGVIPEPYLGWGDFARSGVRVYPVSGGHVTLLTEPHVREVAAALRDAMDGGK